MKCRQELLTVRKYSKGEAILLAGYNLRITGPREDNHSIDSRFQIGKDTGVLT